MAVFIKRQKYFSTLLVAGARYMIALRVTIITALFVDGFQPRRNEIA